MINALGMVVNVLCVVVSLVVGLRLLLLARRTRQLPELLVGTSLVSGGFLGFLLLWVLGMPAFASQPLIPWRTAGRVFVAGSCAAVLIAAWRIFHPGKRWAAVLVAVILVMLVPYAFWYYFVGSLEASRAGDMEVLLTYPAYWIGALGRMAACGWIAWECFRAEARIRRRWRSGLGGDLALASRLWLWGLAVTARALAFVIVPFNYVLTMYLGHALIPSGLVNASLGIVYAVGSWLAFFPPRGYLARITSRVPPVAA